MVCDKCKKVDLVYKYALPLPIMPFYSEDYNNIRRLKIIYLSHKMREFNIFKVISEDNQITIIQKIEQSCLNEVMRKSESYNVSCLWDNDSFVNIYHSICYNIFCNLESEEVIKRIISNEIDINVIGNMTNRELQPEKYEDLTKEIYKRFNTQQAVKFTEMFYCKKCKHNKTKVERIQTRSNDEGSTLSIICLFCNNQWFK